MPTSAQRTGISTGRSKFTTCHIGSVAYASHGTNTTLVAGTHYRAEVFVPFAVQVTGAGVLNGATVGTDKGIVAIYDTRGNLVANSALAGSTTSGANAFQERAFAAAPKLQPGRYFLVYQSNGTTDTLRTIAASTFVDVLAGSATGTFGTMLDFTPPTTFTADKGPVGYLYV